jgi:hypothetical protein
MTFTLFNSFLIVYSSHFRRVEGMEGMEGVEGYVTGRLPRKPKEFGGVHASTAGRVTPFGIGSLPAQVAQ